MTTTTTTTTSASAATDPLDVAAQLFAHLERAWNDGDGTAFGEVFADDTDFVDIRGGHRRGDRAAIGRGHDDIFRTIYAGSTVRYRVDVARPLAPGCILAVATSRLDAPTGPLEGVHGSRITVVLTADRGRWVVTAFHNTLVAGRP
jgi:uncharacterized protein (TIGR02246 family)